MATTTAARIEVLSQARAFQDALMRLLPLVQALERDVAASHGLSAAQAMAMRLCSEDRVLTVNELSVLLRLDKSTASRIAAGLMQKGLITRSRDPSDGRVVRLTASPEGHRLRVSLDHDRALRYAEALSGFEPEVRSAVTRLLCRLAASLGGRATTARGDSPPDVEEVHPAGGRRAGAHAAEIRDQE